MHNCVIIIVYRIGIVDNENWLVTGLNSIRKKIKNTNGLLNRIDIQTPTLKMFPMIHLSKNCRAIFCGFFNCCSNQLKPTICVSQNKSKSQWLSHFGVGTPYDYKSRSGINALYVILSPSTLNMVKDVFPKLKSG